VSIPPGRIAWRHVLLGTMAFALCFAAWGLVGALAPRFREQLGLSSFETGLLVATPVLLGSLARVPMGILADRFGGRVVFSVLMAVTAVPAVLLPRAAVGGYPTLLVAAFFLGLAGSSFAVGTGYVSRWTAREQQGVALGIYGAGNIGQSFAVFLAPVVAAHVGLPAVFQGAAVLLLLGAVGYGLLARNAPSSAPPATVAAMARLVAHERLSWVLSAFYFVTFGGFVAFSIYLPTLLKDLFHLAPADAGLRTAGFVVLATAARPIGGWLSDRLGGASVLRAVFLGIAPFALLLAWPSMIPFTVGALGCAALLGLGNGAVFKLVPQHFPTQTGTVSGLVGAMGGLGGFFPPLLLGAFRDRLGMLWPGFALLAASALALGALNERVLLRRTVTAESATPPGGSRSGEQIRAGAWATLVTGFLAAAIVVGSRNLANFDAALVIYTFAVVFACWGVTYHYVVWLRRPPTRSYWRRGFELARSQGVARSLVRLARLVLSHIALQLFIRRRSRQRWWMHQLLFWGCVLAVLITFPLVFGWIYFRSHPDDQLIYVTYLFGFESGSFRLGTPLAALLFHGLDVAAVLVLGGVALGLWRRMRDAGARAVQDFGRDLLPLVLLFAISVTGLALTVSTKWLRGEYYEFLTILHAVTVVGTLLFLPFGKLFHIFQRPAQLGVKLYQQAGEHDPGALCASCSARFTSRMHQQDLAATLGELDFDYRLGGADHSWQNLCPPCRRRTIARAQLRQKEESRG
jgi:MFS transporter, NNP family, nitrate/nitrite transporter